MKAVIALGSNLGDPLTNLENAIESLKAELHVLLVSTFIETTPVGGPAQGNYLNGVVIAESELEPIELLKILQKIEDAAGRTREVRWGPRTLDLDLISYGDYMFTSDELVLPHPRAHERAFVLEPWLELQPDGVLVGAGPIKDLLARIS